MKDYRRILEVPADATEEQIKAQYKRLVRIYHPDRFANADDKLYVEQKLQEINEAYRALLRPEQNSVDIDYSGPVPQPVALPAVLDFGELVRGKQQTLVFHVENSGGTAQSLQLEYSDVDGWFKVTKGRRLNPQQPFPMEFAVVVDTARLEVGKSYQGWILVRMDSAVARVALAVKVVAKQPLTFLSPRFALLSSLVALLLIVGLLQASNLAAPLFLIKRTSLPTQVNTLVAWLGLNRAPVDPILPTTVPTLPPLAVAVQIEPSPTGDASAALQARTGLGTQMQLAATTPITQSSLQLPNVPAEQNTAVATTSVATQLPLPTVTPLATPVPTNTVLPSPVAEVTAEGQPQPTVSQALAIGQSNAVTITVTIPNNYYVNGRSDTLVEAPVLQILPSRSEWIAVGRTADQEWLLLQIGEEQVAWVVAATVIVQGDSAQLPIVERTADN